MYGNVAGLKLADEAASAAAWLAAAAGHGRQSAAGCVRNRHGEWIDLEAAAADLLERLADAAEKPAAVAELMELHAASADATMWKAADDDWPA